MRRHGPDDKPVAILTDPAKFLNLAEIDHRARGGEPKLQHRDEALTASEYLALVPGLGHSDGGPYGRRKTQEFFKRHLMNGEAIPSASERLGGGI